MALNVAALLMLILAAGIVAYVVYLLGALPGRIAGERHHPQADAVKVLGWLGLLTGGILWAVALVWAFMLPKAVPPVEPAGTPEPPAGNSVQLRDHGASRPQGA